MNLRDGSISGIAKPNPDDNGGFSDNLNMLYSSLGTARAFASDAWLFSNLSITFNASASIDWLEEY